MIEYWQLKQRHSLPLEAKINMSKARIREWYDGNDGLVYVSFSGGKDSTVLRHLVKSIYPDVPDVFMDTGLEFPEIREFVKLTEGVIWLKPEMSFKRVIETLGYPVISKETARKIKDLQNPTERNQMTLDIRMGLTNSKHGYCPKKWLFLKDAPFKVSDRCCDILKKNPAKRYERESKRVPMLGNMADEGRYRLWFYQTNGCNAFGKKRPLSTPIAFWQSKDVWEYIKRFNVPYSKIYDMGYKRTGCVFCMFGVHLNAPNHFQRLAATHPKLWDYCINSLGCGKVMDYIGVDYHPTLQSLQLNLWEE